MQRTATITPPPFPLRERIQMWWNDHNPFKSFKKKEESNLVAHARTELQIAGLFDEDSDYGGMIAEAVMEIIEKFSDQHHSGMSASYVLHLVEKLGRFEALTPLTDNPDEWMECSLVYGGSKPCWQNRRQSNCFSEDGGKTYYNIDVGDRNLIQSEPHTVKHEN